MVTLAHGNARRRQSEVAVAASDVQSELSEDG